MVKTDFTTTNQLEAGLDEVRRSPKNEGVLEMIVCRPNTDERRLLTEGQLDLAEGLLGDNWRARGSTSRPDGSANPDTQVTIMNSRAATLVAQKKERWQLAGDQLIMDLDISAENLPPGTRLAIGSAILEVSAQPHTGCKKFVGHFGLPAMEFVNSPAGRELHLRGINARVVQPGLIRVGDIVRKV
jgi:hypothetical protein